MIVRSHKPHRHTQLTSAGGGGEIDFAVGGSVGSCREPYIVDTDDVDDDDDVGVDLVNRVNITHATQHIIATHVTGVTRAVRVDSRANDTY
jgi:hypothetical protein